MDNGVSVKALENAAARASQNCRTSKRKHSQLQRKAEITYQEFVLWLRMVWLLGAGHPHLMRCAWEHHQEQVDKFWDPQVVSRERVFTCIAKDFSEERLSDEDAWSLFQPTTKGDIRL